MVMRYEFTISSKSVGPAINGKGRYVKYADYQELEADNRKLREQRDAANAQIQMLNSIIAGDVV